MKKLIITSISNRISSCSVQFKDVWLNFLRHPGFYHLFICSEALLHLLVEYEQIQESIDESQICTQISLEAHSLFLKESTYLTWCRTSSYSFKLSKFRKFFAYKCVTNALFVTFPFFCSNCNISWGNVSRKDNVKKSVMTNHDVTIILLDARYKSTLIMP